jgi:cytidylate kinase
MYARTIAIDGPAGSGKSTVGAMLADRIGHIFLDAGLLYRAITHEALANNLPPDDAVQMAGLAEALRVDIQATSTGSHLMLINGEDIAAGLHSDAVSRAVAIAAAHPEVRAHVRRIQMQIARHHRVVYAGRDIGTVVLPNADLKIFLYASLEERAARRYAALSQTSLNASLERIREDLRLRDEMDTHRAESPMKMADDAILLKTDGMTIEDVLEQLLSYARRSNNRNLMRPSYTA